MLKIVEATNRRAVRALLAPERTRDAATERRVARIIAAVRERGDAALVDFARRFDALDGPIEITRDDMHSAAAGVPRDVRTALRNAARHIRAVALRQVPRGWRARLEAGVTVEQRVLPLDRVGCYVPAGRYPLPSSLLMTAIPASAAGVRDIIVACPRPAPVIMAAALEARITRMFHVGGAHAIAAMAYGTETVPRVDKIVGPGNRYVAAAKALVAADCAIDFNAGPTELVVISSEREPRQIAMDLVAQAEHDPAARAILLTTSRPLARAVEREVAALAPLFGAARESIGRHGAIVITRTIRDAVALANRIAPEHLACDDERVARRVRNAGTIFVGSWSVPAAGDYATGSNHVLPTAGAARARGGLTAADFIKTTTVQRVTRAGLRRLAPAAVTLARAESLEGHARSIEERL